VMLLGGFKGPRPHQDSRPSQWCGVLCFKVLSQLIFVGPFNNNYNIYGQ
jgi:hypothetical protein